MRRVLLAGLPVTERRITVAGVVTNVLEGGEGPPLLLLHGGIHTGGVYWAPLLPALAQRYRIIVPDAPGLGESEPVAMAHLDQPQFDRWFGGLLDVVSTEPPALVGHSLIGTLAASYACRYGARLRALTIYGAPGVGPFRMPLGLAFAAIMFDLRPTVRNQARFLRWVFNDPLVTRAQHPEWFAAFETYYVERGQVPHIKRTMRCLVRDGTRRLPVSDLARIRVPTSLLWGRDDRMAPLATAEFASAALGWPLHIVEHAGHAPHLERPDAFLETLSRALPHFESAPVGGAQ